MNIRGRKSQSSPAGLSALFALLPAVHWGGYAKLCRKSGLEKLNIGLLVVTDSTRKVRLAKIQRDALSTLVTRLEQEERELLEAAVKQLIAESEQLEVSHIWTPDDLVGSYWVLLMSGVDQTDELDIATELLQWREFSAKGSARVACIPSSERRLFSLISSKFAITRCPTLLIANDVEMAEVLRIEPQLLSDLVEARGSFRKLLTEVHSLIELGESLGQISEMLQREDFFRRLKLVYAEAKSLISLKVQL